MERRKAALAFLLFFCLFLAGIFTGPVTQEAFGRGSQAAVRRVCSYFFYVLFVLDFLLYIHTDSEVMRRSVFVRYFTVPNNPLHSIRMKIHNNV